MDRDWSDSAQLQAREQLWSPDVGRSKERFLSKASEGSVPLPYSLVSDFWPPELLENKFLF